VFRRHNVIRTRLKHGGKGRNADAKTVADRGYGGTSIVSGKVKGLVPAEE
jgi:hypothetical protein